MNRFIKKKEKFMDSNMPKNIDPYINSSGSVNENFVERDSWKASLERFYTDMSNLVEREGQLIRAEMGEKVTQIKAASISVVTGGAILFVGLLCVAATTIILLAMVTELWLSAIIVTVAFLVIGGIMVTGGLKKLKVDKLKPYKSLEAFGEIRHSLQEKVHEITKH
jgi:uncharacterized membrane protein YqjE